MPALVTVFNKTLETGKVPKDWKEAILVAIPKPGKDPSIPTNTRGISLLDAAYKIFAAALH